MRYFAEVLNGEVIVHETEQDDPTKAPKKFVMEHKGKFHFAVCSSKQDALQYLLKEVESNRDLAQSRLANAVQEANLVISHLTKQGFFS